MLIIFLVHRLESMKTVLFFLYILGTVAAIPVGVFFFGDYSSPTWQTSIVNNIEILQLKKILFLQWFSSVLVLFLFV